jgi:hypothetical protein
MVMQPRKFFFILFVSLLASGASSYAQKNSIGSEETEQLGQLEDSLVVLADSMLHAGVTDDRIEFCVQFTKKLRAAFEVPGSFNYAFSKLSSKIHIIYPDDKSFRIFNWLIVPSENIRRYFGAVQMAGEEPRYFPLRDYTDHLEKDAETLTLNSNQWYGCEYYKIMSQMVRGQKAYLLFGFNSNGMTSNKKVLDIMSFDAQGPLFGAPVFMMPDARGQRLVQQNRVILEYKKDAQIYLNYDEAKKMILFSRLASEITDPNRKNTYIPTGQMDGLRWENNVYMFVRDAVPVLKLQDGQAPINGVMNGG